MREITFSQAVMEAQMEEMKRDSSIFVIGEDVAKMGSAFGQCAGLYDMFGSERVFNMPVAESGYANFAVGAAMAGKRPVVEMQFADFIVLAIDSVGNNGPKQRYMSGGQWSVPMVVRGPQGAGFGAAATHSQMVDGWFMNFPGLKIVVPSTPYDAKGLLKTAIRDNDPVLFLEHKKLLGIKGEVPEEEYTIPLGKAKLVKEGKDVTIIAIQDMINCALEAATELANEEISVEIIDPRTLIPLDKEIIGQSIRKTGRVVVVHEAPKRGSAASEIAAVIAEDFFSYLKAPVMRVGAANTPLPFGMPETYCLPNKIQILQSVREILK
ncbi:MAG: alpha-ketoacid dehydrogenase subunit beta [Peptococcales bacterium]|jgi:pyruvate/2-oxoglutarate/acetoin dehydrogenase E1 component